MMLQLSAAASAVASSAPTFLIIKGAGGTFCSGADIGEAKGSIMPEGGSSEGGRMMAEHMSRVTNLIATLPRTITIAAIDGAAFGGGAELATCCDFRSAAIGGEVMFVQASMGVTTGWGGGRRLAAIVGRRRALRLLAFGERVGAAEGERMGLIDFVAEEGETAGDCAERLAAEGGAALNPVTKSWKRVVDGTVEEEVEVFAEHWNQEGHREAFRRAMEKKK